MKPFICIILILAYSIRLPAQDIQYSQFYAAPLFLNPAFAGSEDANRLGVNSRNQWPGLDYSFNAYSAYYDYHIEQSNGNIGFILNGSQESLSQINNTELGFIYAYRLQLDENQFIHVGGQMSYVSRNAIFEELVFGSQIDIDRGIIDGSNNLP